MQRIHATSGRTRTVLTREPLTRGTCRPGQCSHGLSPHAAWRASPSGRSPHAPSSRRTWLCGRGCCVDRCRRTLAWRLGLALAGGPQEAAAEEIEARPAKHLALQHFEAIDVPLDGARTPGQGHARFDRLVVLVEPGGKALHGLQRTRGRALQPGIELRRAAAGGPGGESPARGRSPRRPRPAARGAG